MDGIAETARTRTVRENGTETEAAEDRTLVYPPAKLLPEFIIICSTTDTVCGLRPWGARPLWYQIILWGRTKKSDIRAHMRGYIQLGTYTDKLDTRAREIRKIRLVTLEDEKEKNIEEANSSPPPFYYFYSEWDAISSPVPSTARWYPLCIRICRSFQNFRVVARKICNTNEEIFACKILCDNIINILLYLFERSDGCCVYVLFFNIFHVTSRCGRNSHFWYWLANLSYAKLVNWM